MITLIIFALFRIFDVARVIQMNMEISIVLAYGCLVLPPMQEMVEVKYTHIFTQILTTILSKFILFCHIYIVFVIIIGMPGRIHSDTLFLHDLFHVYAFRKYTHVFTCSFCCAKRWPHDKDTSMNYGLLLNRNIIQRDLNVYLL